MAIYTLPDNIYNRILTCIGYPVVKEEDFGVTKDFIIDTLIYPAIMYYHKYFPIEVRENIPVDMNSQIPFPDDNTIGVLNIQMNSNVLGGGTHVMNPLINDMNITIQTSGGSRGQFGVINDYGYNQVRTYKSIERQSIVENTRTVRYTVDEHQRLVDIFTNIYGRMEITWAKISDDWKDIVFRRQEEVIMMSKAYILEHFGNIQKQISTQLPTEMTGDSFLEEAGKLREKVEAIWNEFTKVVILRG